jgi:hypothetical protein
MESPLWRVVGRVPSSKKGKSYTIEQDWDGNLRCPCDGFKWRARCTHVKQMADMLAGNHGLPTGLLNAGESEMPELKFKLTFKRGPDTMAEIIGVPRTLDALTAGDVGERIIETEQYLERLTGLRVHIETAED